MAERHNILKHGGTTTYPGYRGGNGYVENLSTYRANCMIEKSNDRRLILSDDEDLAFDIERHISWGEQYNLLPFKYSMMIDGYYPIRKWPFLGRESKPSKEEFAQIASQLEGFVLDEESQWVKDGGLMYRSSDKNVFVNWSSWRKRICLGVIQQKPLLDLNIVTNEIVPYAVSLFNRLSPALQLTDFVVDMSIDAALLSNKLIPKCRIEGK